MPSSSGLRSSMVVIEVTCSLRSVVEPVGAVRVAGPVRLCRGCRWCTPRRRGRWWPGAARGVPSTREMTSVSASHSWGNSSATWATGQWCWQSCSPTGHVARRGGVPLGGERPGQRLGRLELGVAAWTAPKRSLDERRRRRRRELPAPRRRRRSRRGSAAPATARSSYAWSKPSRPASVSANTLAGRPRPRVAVDCAARGPRRCPRRAAGRGGGGRRPGSARAARRAPPRWTGRASRIDRATRSRVRASVVQVRGLRRGRRSDFHNVSVRVNGYGAGSSQAPRR